MDESMFSDGGDGSDFESPVKQKVTKKAPSKTAASKAVAKPAAAKKQTLPKITKKKKPTSDDENSDADDTAFNDDSILSQTPPVNKKLNKAPKKTGGKPLQPIDNESFAADADAMPSPAPPSTGKKANNSDKYQKLTQLEHILKRPDTYIGSVERTEQPMWVFNSETELMEHREVSFVPGLYKIFDEILVNAADNKQNDKNMNEIRVWVDREKGEIAVRNNGKGIPVEIHAKEKMYIPEMIFGHLLTGSNYDDDKSKITGGRNGYGAKLCNIFSTKFMIETVDSKTKKKYRQVWHNNMSKMDKASITDVKMDDYTKVTFYPDFAKFGMEKMDDDFEALVKRRVYDLAGTCAGVKVYLNDTRLKISKFKQYMEMYTKAIKNENLIGGETSTTPEHQVILTDSPDARWEIGFAVSDGSFQQVSFVNSIATTFGGTHVNYIADQIVNKLAEVVKKKNKGGVTLKNAQIKNHMFLFVNCHIVNPAFTSQTKEQLTTKSSQFGSKCTVSEKFLKDIAKTEVITNILDFAQKKADQVLKKSDGSKRSRMNNPKLTDANRAGTKDGWKCTLILTEGDSASALALAGRAVVNSDLFGVFPLRGKLLNVRDASIDQISKNQEIQNIKQFMGLQHKKEYEDTRGLRYGHLMIMTDQDHDGSHIKGLLINFLQCQYPSLLKIPGFLLEFITPIVKVWKGDIKNPRQKRDFFTMPEYEAWRLEPGNDKWEHKYFKGLGTSRTSDAQTYFSDLDKHLKQFHTIQEHEHQLIDLAFSKKKADDRKMWLQNFVPGTYLDMSGTEAITYDDFINKELILFSMADNQRSIPSVVDGFKPGQRKVLYTCFRRKLTKDVKVVELAGSVSGLTAYAYGDTSLQQTIVGLAQDFVGSNNINTLEPSGNFGSRLQGGSDAASARYIYTRLSPFASRIFHAADEPLLTYNLDDGKTIEPEVYMPVLPMILVNGADGIGTGWSTQIPNYNPEEIIENLKRRMNGTGKSDMLPMMPWFRGWDGKTEDVGEGRFKFTGKWVVDEERFELDITELPVRVWTQDFKDKLETIIRAEKAPSFIKDYAEYNTPEKIHFILKMTQADFNKHNASSGGFEELFKLSKSLTTSNLVAFDAQGRIHKYETPLDIMEEFYHVRLDFYAKRKAYLLGEMNRMLERLSNQSRFVKMIIDGKLVVSKKKKPVLVAELQKLGFKRFPKVSDAKKQGEFEAVVDAEDGEGDDEAGASDYDYLLGMAIWSLTQERVEKLLRQIGDKELEIDTLTKKTPKDIWCEDLDAVLEEWKMSLEDDSKRAKKAIAIKGRRTSAKLGITGKAKKRKAGEDDDSDFDGGAKKKAPKVNALAKIAKAQSSTESWMESKDTRPPGTYSGLFSIDGTPIAPAPAEKAGLIKPSTTTAKATSALKAIGASKKVAKIEPSQDVAMIDVSDVKDESEVSARPAARSRGAAAKPKKYDLSSDEESNEEFHEVEEVASSKATSRAPSKAPETAKPKGRAAAKKKTYATGSDDDSGFNDDDLGDISTMVKGTTAAPSGRPLLSSSRPGATHSLKQQAAPSQRKQSPDIDDTDWGKLAEGSPHKDRAAASAYDEDDESLLLSSPAKKPLKKTAGKLGKPAAKAKPAPAKAAPKKKKADEELADELLSDDDGPAVSRPARRAVVQRKKYVDEDESEDGSDGSEAFSEGEESE